jgi:heme-degrading monooxygenase HmoA
VILEHAVIPIRPGTASQFEAALAQARPLVAASPGFCWLQAHRGIEEPDRYHLLIGWETLEDHVEGFRTSEAFSRWRALIGPYFAAPPEVEHLAPVPDLS